MTTIINTPPASSETSDNSGVGVVVGILIALLIVIFFLVFGLPYLRDRPQDQASPVAPSSGTTVNVTTPPNTAPTANTKTTY